jgi:hypothetical protein
MAENPLSSVVAYSQFLAVALDRPGIIRSTITVVHASKTNGLDVSQLRLQRSVESFQPQQPIKIKPQISQIKAKKSALICEICG